MKPKEQKIIEVLRKCTEFKYEDEGKRYQDYKMNPEEITECTKQILKVVRNKDIESLEKTNEKLGNFIEKDLEDKEYKEGMEYIMAKEKAEKKVLEEIRKFDWAEISKEIDDSNDFLKHAKASAKMGERMADKIKSWQEKLK